MKTRVTLERALYFPHSPKEPFISPTPHPPKKYIFSKRLHPTPLFSWWSPHIVYLVDYMRVCQRFIMIYGFLIISLQCSNPSPKEYPSDPTFIFPSIRLLPLGSREKTVKTRVTLERASGLTSNLCSSWNFG